MHRNSLTKIVALMVLLAWVVPTDAQPPALPELARPQPPLVRAAPPLHRRPPDLATPEWDYWIGGNTDDARPPALQAGLLLAGGGGHVTPAWKWFVDCAGCGDILVLTAAGSDSYQDFLWQSIGGMNSVQTINFKDPAASHDPRVLDLIGRAEAIFLAGGKQTRYIAWWKGTPVAKAINAHLAAGKPVGGSSAGLAILGKYYYGSLYGSVTTKSALANPYFQMVDLGTDFLTASPLEGILLDTHFSTRQRLGRLVTFLGRITVDWPGSQPVGLGIDEATALCVEADGNSRLISSRAGFAWLVEPTQPPTLVARGQPLVVERVKVTCIGPESTIQLPARRVTNPVSVRYVSAREGIVREEPENECSTQPQDR